MNREQINAANKRYYDKHPEYFKEKQDRLRAERKQYILSSLNHKCAECGEDDESLLEIDHINPSLKTNRQSILSMGRDKINEELTNCQLLCHNCHVKRSTAQKKAAWSLFCQLSLEEQNELINQFL